MEEIENFDDWLKNIDIPKVEYFAIFDTNTRAVIGIYPSHSAKNIPNKILIDKDIAESVFNGIASMSSFFVDDIDGNLELVQTQVVKKIDDILHRIVDRKYADFNNPDLIIQIDILNKKVSFVLDSKVRSKNIRWDKTIKTKFIFSEYNDPYKFFQVIEFKIEDLYKKDLEFKYDGIDDKFSVFTSRIFKKNVLEIV
jgi:hypothetical protein